MLPLVVMMVMILGVMCWGCGLGDGWLRRRRRRRQLALKGGQRSVAENASCHFVAQSTGSRRKCVVLGVDLACRVTRSTEGAGSIRARSNAVDFIMVSGQNGTMTI